MYAQLPMFHRIGAAAYKANLDNTIAICDLLNNPQHQFKSIHIAGTNGKGSTSHLLASILQSAGLKVGLYTSPHLKDFRERIKINGKMISQQQVSRFINTYKTDFEKIQPSFFEMTVGLAFDYFAAEKVDIAVIEVGLGGRLDSTNILVPEVSVITNISFDHTALLGNTLEKIAGEKAGIIKPNIPVVIGETQTETQTVFTTASSAQQAPLVFADQQYHVTRYQHIQQDHQLLLCMDIYQGSELKYKALITALPGLYQLKNIQTVLAVTAVLNKKGYQLTEPIIREGLKNVVTQTGLLGRWQLLGEQPLVIADTGPKEAGIKVVMKQLRVTVFRELHIVLGMVSDKDISGVLALFPTNAKYYFCRATIPRALDPSMLAQLAGEKNLRGEVYDSVIQAFNAAKQQATIHDLVLITGSTFTVAEVI